MEISKFTDLRLLSGDPAIRTVFSYLEIPQFEPSLAKGKCRIHTWPRSGPLLPAKRVFFFFTSRVLRRAKRVFSFLFTRKSSIQPINRPPNICKFCHILRHFAAAAALKKAAGLNRFTVIKILVLLNAIAHMAGCFWCGRSFALRAARASPVDFTGFVLGCIEAKFCKKCCV